MQNTSGSVHQRGLEYSTMVVTVIPSKRPGAGGNHQQCWGMIFTSVVRCSESGGVSTKTPSHLTASGVISPDAGVNRTPRISLYVVHLVPI